MTGLLINAVVAFINFDIFPMKKSKRDDQIYPPFSDRDYSANERRQASQ
jgi:hypothetical protein